MRRTARVPEESGSADLRQRSPFWAFSMWWRQLWIFLARRRKTSARRTQRSSNFPDSEELFRQLCTLFGWRRCLPARSATDGWMTIGITGIPFAGVGLTHEPRWLLTLLLLR